MRLACLVGDVGGDDEVVEHGVQGLRHNERNVGCELTLFVGGRLAFGQQLVVAACAYVAAFPVA